MPDRTYEEDVAYWLGFVDGEEPEEEISPMLPHLTDQEIMGLGDSYDDGRIDTLAYSYVKLRNALLLIQQITTGKRHDI